MTRAPVDLTVGGETYRVVASADDDTLQRYARVVDEKLRQMSHGTGVHPRALLLAALALAHELEEERHRREHAERRCREMLENVLERIDAALDTVDENGDPLPPVTFSPRP